MSVSFMLFVNHRNTLTTGFRLLLISLSASLMIVVLRTGKNLFKDEDALKREQTLQIDVAFIIHGSKNITSPPRKKSLKEALNWAKKITKAFGEVGVNKTNIGLILYAEKAKLMFNMTEKLDKGAVMAGLDKASSPPALGNKTFTGKALKLALKTLVKETRKEAIKKFFVFVDRPPDDDPTSAAEAIKEKEVEVYGLSGKNPSTWYIHDFSLDSMYEMLKEGPFNGSKGNQERMKDESLPDPSSVPTQNPSCENHVSNPGNQTSTSESTVLNRENQEAKPISYSIDPTKNSDNAMNPTPTREAYKFKPINLRVEHQISGLISKEQGAKDEEYADIKYGKDASVVITEQGMKNKNSVGRYSSTSDVTPSATEFGTVIGGVRVNGQSKFDVIKPSNNSQNENSNLRSKLGIRKINKRG